ncbi:MAG: DNA-binding transcriptional ArsR family regulator [Afipia broomeae]|jgi:DNA-binding transcriptional ArsR family regulator|uniref:Transcriptional regulator, ArsR family n=3 Tax=Rhodobacterales TaxID=204455 RepID=A0A1H3ECB2_9RHOB|nr:MULTISPECIES: metalloregulator ArsR/SmtB family transcription factor [Rhodobacterales]MEE4211896.1 metalloregulator ArsR/SmtB family transcription factor [Parvularcula sp.]QIE43857.1 winged helix-turn-helix transcriptional regulator [Rhodobacteraceae bacterium SC52]AUQ64877.1 putative HTH-type transcriptional regulator, ArsR family [Phaeobacter inhibens]MBB5723404.1 DNA-binding transcriptional ArsR family regulator [Yoonia ponticola]TDL85426.1 ArsR family transcriptional regulator [Fluviiba
MTARDIQDDLSASNALELRAKLFRGLSDPSRLAILNALVSGERSVQEIVAHSGLGQPNVSNHLRCLLDCGLVSRRTEGRFVRYRLADRRVASLIHDADRLLAATGAGIDTCERYTE